MSVRVSVRQREGPTLEMLDYAIRIGRTPTLLYFDLYITKVLLGCCSSIAAVYTTKTHCTTCTATDRHTSVFYLFSVSL